MTPVAEASSSQLAAPLPTPSQPRVSAWDFLDPFQVVESCHHQDQPAPAATPVIHGPSLSSDDIEEDEDIHELEELHETSSSDDELDNDKSDGNSSCEEEAEGHIEFRSSDAISSIVDGVETGECGGRTTE